jgi:hypothetical protein
MSRLTGRVIEAPKSGSAVKSEITRRMSLSVAEDSKCQSAIMVELRHSETTSLVAMPHIGHSSRTVNFLLKAHRAPRAAHTFLFHDSRRRDTSFATARKRGRSCPGRFEPLVSARPSREPAWVLAQTLLVQDCTNGGFPGPSCPLSRRRPRPEPAKKLENDPAVGDYRAGADRHNTDHHDGVKHGSLHRNPMNRRYSFGYRFRATHRVEVFINQATESDIEL